MKLVVSMYRERPRGEQWILWPGGVGELRVVSEFGSEDAGDRADHRQAVDAILAGLQHAKRLGAAIDTDDFRNRVAPILLNGPPFDLELVRLGFRDPKTGTPYRVEFRFSPSHAEVVVTGGGNEIVLVRSEGTFIDSEGIFPVTRTIVTGDQVSFRNRNGTELISLELDDLRR